MSARESERAKNSLFCLEFVEIVSKILTAEDINEPKCKGVGLGKDKKVNNYSKLRRLWTDYFLRNLSENNLVSHVTVLRI